MTPFSLLQVTVVLRGLASNVQQAVNLLHTSCDEAERSCREVAAPLEPHQAALFSLPELRTTGLQIVDAVERKNRVRCQVYKGTQASPAFNGVNVQVISLHCIGLLRPGHFPALTCGL